MPKNFEYRCVYLDLQEVNSKEELDTLLLDFASTIWSEHLQAKRFPSEMKDLVRKIKNEMNPKEQDIVNKLANTAALYLDRIIRTNTGTSLLVRTEHGREYHSCDFADRLACFLFGKSHNPYFEICSALFDKRGGRLNHWIGYRKDGKVVIEDSTDFLNNFFKNTSEALVR